MTVSEDFDLSLDRFVSPADMLLKWAKEKPNEIYLKQMINRKFVEFTYAQVADKALRLVNALNALGMKEGDKIALLSKNCAEWFICDLAFMLGKFISVPIFPTSLASNIEYCLTHSEASVMIVGKLDSAKEVNQAMRLLPEIISIGLPYDSDVTCQYQWSSLIDKASPIEPNLSCDPSDLMSIAYTSGTSGPPKGAILTYGAFVWSVEQLIQAIEVQPSDKLFSYLPLAHITERVYVFGTSIMAGIVTAFPESLDTFIDDVKRHQPTLFISVPRLWGIFQHRVLDKLPQSKLSILLSIPILNGFIKKKIAKGLGLNKARVLGCGSAPVSPALLRWYHSIGLNITEAWGLTETFAYSTFNYPFRADKIGTVGRAGPGIEIRIADNDEVLVKSQGMFSGYYKNCQEYDDGFDGLWLKTGDMGHIDTEGYLSIQGRIKDSFKTAKGKFVAPVDIEKTCFELMPAEMLCLIGAGLTAPILLLVRPYYKQFDKQRFSNRLKKNLAIVNEGLESHAKIKGILVVDEPWSVENNLLTPTLKIKRHLLEKKYNESCQHWPEHVEIIWEEDWRKEDNV